MGNDCTVVTHQRAVNTGSAMMRDIMPTSLTILTLHNGVSLGVGGVVASPPTVAMIAIGPLSKLSGQPLVVAASLPLPNISRVRQAGRQSQSSPCIDSHDVAAGAVLQLYPGNLAVETVVVTVYT